MKMTEQEARELSDLLTRTDPEIGPNGTGYLSMLEARQIGLYNFVISNIPQQYVPLNFSILLFSWKSPLSSTYEK